MGIDSLDGMTTSFAVDTEVGFNAPPLAIGLPEDNTIDLDCDDAINDFVISFVGPEGDQSVALAVAGETDADLSINVTNGSTAMATINWAPSERATVKPIIMATDDGTPPKTTNVTLTLNHCTSPSAQPSNQPSLNPSTMSSSQPSSHPSSTPSYTALPSNHPIGQPSLRPTTSFQHSNRPSNLPSSSSESVVQIDILTDIYPEETTWTLINNCSGEITASGGPYSIENNLFSTTLTVDAGQYNFTVNDSFGDGIFCSGDCFRAYNVTYDGNLVVSGRGDFGTSESTLFGSCGP